MMLLRRFVSTVTRSAMPPATAAMKPMSVPLQVVQQQLPLMTLTQTPSFGFAFKAFPSMFKTQYIKGRLNCRFRTKNTSWKRGFKKAQKPHVQSANNALMKRIKIVGVSYDRKLKFKSANHRHQLRKKSRACLNRKKKARYAHSTDFKRLRRLIPLLKQSSFKANH